MKKIIEIEIMDDDCLWQGRALLENNWIEGMLYSCSNHVINQGVIFGPYIPKTTTDLTFLRETGYPLTFNASGENGLQTGSKNILVEQGQRRLGTCYIVSKERPENTDKITMFANMLKAYIDTLISGKNLEHYQAINKIKSEIILLKQAEALDLPDATERLQTRICKKLAEITDFCQKK